MITLQGMTEAAAAGLRHPVVTLGVFDGVHLGHRFVLGHVIKCARERLGAAVVVTFASHPRAVLAGEPPKLITSLAHRLRLFETLGMDATVVLEFDEALRSTAPLQFARTLFGDSLHADHVVLGWNNRFGAGGRGDLATLRSAGAECGFSAEELDEVRVGGLPLSSTRIREAILSGDLAGASRMLGRPCSVLGTVVHGAGRGRQIGVPTANLDLHHEVRPPRGVYGCALEIDGQRRFAVVNIGVRPTVDAPKPAAQDWASRDAAEHVEVHVMDTDCDLYGRDLEVVFLTHLRAEARFADLTALRAQIGQDIRAFREWLAAHQS